MITLRTLAASALVMTLASACSSETGVVVAVTTTSALDSLRFFVGVRDADDTNGKFLLDQGVSGLEVDVKGRSLSARPYELLLKDPGGPQAELRILVLGIKNGVQLFGFTKKPQKMMEGQVVRRTLPLSGNSSSHRYINRGRCQVVTNREEPPYLIHPADDLDCDGVGTKDQPPDCDDKDDEKRPGLFEYCDGKDNACDGSPPVQSACYAQDSSDQLCRAGSRPCDEGNGGAVTGQCAIAGDPVPLAYCAKYATCTKEYLDPLRCARTQVNIRRYTCTLKTAQGGAPCGAGVSTLEQPKSATACQWRVVRSGGYTVTFEHEETKGVQIIEQCKPALRVAMPDGATTGGTVVLEFFPDGNPGYVREFTIALEPADSCDKPWRCTEKK